MRPEILCETRAPIGPRTVRCRGAGCGTVFRLCGSCWRGQAYCGAICRLRSWRSDPKELSTLHGRIILHRPYFYCRSCRTGCHPLDAQLQLAAATHQFDIQERSTRLGAEIPFGLSEEQFQRLTGVQASSSRPTGPRRPGGHRPSIDRSPPAPVGGPVRDGRGRRMSSRSAVDASGGGDRA